MAKREFVMLAHTYNPVKHGVASYMVSEKLDGIRAFWDGGFTCGMPTSEIPWANTDKDHIYKKQMISTGLWTRYGHVIHAPKWFTDQLDGMPLDGELWMGRRKFQRTMSIVRKHDPIDSEWENISYKVFDSPNFFTIFADGRINNTNYKKTFDGIVDWAFEHAVAVFQLNRFTPFEFRLKALKNRLIGNEVIQVLDHIQLPPQTDAAHKQLDMFINAVLDKGGEGVILRKRAALYSCERSYDILKFKPWFDDEAVVIGYKWADETDMERSISGEVTNKLLGLMGSLVLEYKGHRFKLSGFTDVEREMVDKAGSYSAARDFGELHPNEEVSDEFENPTFRRGSIVTFKYRELSDDGVPKEARFFRGGKSNPD